ncbi:hypothetical protein [Streptomyces sp. NPDC056304]|uniref:hypothetical protein n=1 Tax=Streptomyces sp. NPDC056304 TaxID=3345778 RepID=UPI0035DC7486
MSPHFLAFRSISADGGVRWVVVDAATYALHPQATAYLTSLRSRGCSANTERAYVGRVALYLDYCRDRGVDWAAPGFLELAGLQRWLVSEPLAPAGARRLSRGSARPGRRTR